MEEAFQMLMKHVTFGGSICFIIDCDVDGYTSSAVFYNYLKDHLMEKYGFTLDYHVPTGKEHGLRNSIMNWLTEKKLYDLIILPDSSSNDYEEHKILKEMGYDILVIDHHEAEKYSENAVVINNQLSESYENKALSGVGVVYKFLDYVDSKIGGKHAHTYLDLVALGEISDVMNMNTLENRLICDYGLANIRNGFFQELVRKQCYSIFGIKAEDWDDYMFSSGDLTQVDVAFYITPLINGLIRVGSAKEKENLFKAFITPDIKVPSTKRGHKDGEMETISEQVVRNCVNAKAKQNKEKERAMELLSIQIQENCLDENKIIVLHADDLDIPNTLTGLCAMGIAAEYKKPVLLGRINPDGYLKGSIRGKEGSELNDFKDFLLRSGLMEFVEGHQMAAGFSIKDNKVDKLIDYANKELANINFNEGFYEADFIMKASAGSLTDLIYEISNENRLWGQGNPQPVIVTENISVSARSINIIGSNKDTVRFEYNGVTYIKFKANDLIEKLNACSGILKINVVGRPALNRYAGRVTPQILITDIDIEENKLYEF